MLITTICYAKVTIHLFATLCATKNVKDAL
jgi:hypothetical protein